MVFVFTHFIVGFYLQCALHHHRGKKTSIKTFFSKRHFYARLCRMHFLVKCRQYFFFSPQPFFIFYGFFHTRSVSSLLSFQNSTGGSQRNSTWHLFLFAISWYLCRRFARRLVVWHIWPDPCVPILHPTHHRVGSYCV